MNKRRSLAPDSWQPPPVKEGIMNSVRRHLITAAALSVMVSLGLGTINNFGGIASRAETAGISLLEVSSRKALDAIGGSRFNGKLVFSSDRHNGRGLSIWTMTPDGSSPTLLTDEKSRTDRLPNFVPVYDLGPVWAPDGTRIAFTSNRDYVFAVYIMNADGSNAHLLTDKVQDPASLAWSPDSSKIALSGGIRGVPAGAGAQPSVHIYTVNIDGSQLTKLTSDGINDSPTWSPDGRQIAFNSNRDADGRSKI